MTILQLGARLYRDAVLVTQEVVNGGTTVTQLVRQRVGGFYPTAQYNAALAAVHAQIGYWTTYDEAAASDSFINFLDYSLLQPATPAGLSDAEAEELRGWAFAGFPNIDGFQGWTYLYQDFLVPVQVDQADVTQTQVNVLTPGWDAGAISADSFSGWGRVKFNVQASNKFVIGMCDGGNPLDPYGRFFGVAFEKDVCWDFYRTTSHATNPMGQLDEGNLGGLRYTPVDDATTFTVQWLRNILTITQYNAAGSVVWTSTRGLALGDEIATGSWTLGAAIYSPGSWVLGYEVSGWVGMDEVLPALAGRGGAGTPKSQAITRMPKLQSRGRMATRGAGSLPKLASMGGRRIAVSSASLPKLTGRGSQIDVFVGANRAQSRLPLMTSHSHSITGEVGQAAVRLPLLKARGTKNKLADSAVSLPRLRGAGFALPADHATMYSAMFASVTAVPTRLTLAVLTSTLTATPTMASAMLFNVSMPTGVTSSTPTTLKQILQALMLTEVSTDASVPFTPVGAEVWVMNMANNATSTYEDFNFNSFGSFNGRGYGLRKDGLYLLEGDTDAGSPIRASVSYGKQDFNSKARKHLERAYVGVSSKGTMYLKVTANGTEYIYAARTSSTELKQQRFDVGRGLQATYFTFELFNKNGGDFEIDNVSFFAIDFTRRV
jgi:hypothetical protein